MYFIENWTRGINTTNRPALAAGMCTKCAVYFRGDDINNDMRHDKTKSRDCRWLVTELSRFLFICCYVGWLQWFYELHSSLLLFPVWAHFQHTWMVIKLQLSELVPFYSILFTIPTIWVLAQKSIHIVWESIYLKENRFRHLIGVWNGLNYQMGQSP